MHNINKFIVQNTKYAQKEHRSLSRRSSTLSISSVEDEALARSELNKSRRAGTAGQHNIDPPPPRDISKENLAVWVGWTSRSDSQIIREAALKGLVPLATQFLKLQGNIEETHITTFIKNEVFSWINELLERKMISNICTILKNLDLDPKKELEDIFVKSATRDRRDYIGNFLIKNGMLDKSVEELWHLLEIIIENNALIQHGSLTLDNISSLMDLGQSWCQKVAVKLFLNKPDPKLTFWINPESLWAHLLSTKDTFIMKIWIKLQYSQYNAQELDANMEKLLKSLTISEQMIYEFSCSEISKEEILNELAQYGVFVSEEKDFLSVLRRVNEANSLENLFDILTGEHSNLSLVNFIPMMVNYCQSDFLIPLNWMTNKLDILAPESEHLQIIQGFRRLVPDFGIEDLRDNIFKVSRYLGRNLRDYFRDNPLVFLSLMVLQKEGNFEQCMQNKSVIIYGKDFSDCLEPLLKKCPIIANLYERKIGRVSCQITYLDLIERHFKINCQEAFAHKPISNFNTPSLKKYSYKKGLNYSFYVKKYRPSIASKMAFTNIEAQKRAFKIALKSFQNNALCASCISFLEMVGIDSKGLRVCIKAARLLCQSGMDPENVVSLFLNLERDPKAVLILLDENIVKFMDFSSLETSGDDFMEAVRLYDVVVDLSQLFNLPLPDSFLKNLTQRNLWLPFLIYCQYRHYPLEQVKEICSNFTHPYLLEHVVHSVLNDIQVDKDNVLMKQRDSRKYLLSRLGLRKSVDGGGGSLRSSIGSTSSSNDSELEIDISNTKATLLQILIRCHNSSDPPRALLQACQLYRNPLLAVLATSYEPDSVITNWLTWLAVSCDSYQMFTNFETISSNCQEVASLLNNCMKNRFPKTVYQSCLIFIPDNPLTTFCEFLYKLILREHSLEKLGCILQKFKSSKSLRRTSVLSQTDYDLSYLKNKSWIELVTGQLLCTTVINNFDSLSEQIDFVDLLCKLKIQTYFTCQLPSFDKLYTIMTTLFDTGVKLDLSKYLDINKCHEAVQLCVNELANLGLFEKALIIGRCQNVNTDSTVLKKWQRIFEQQMNLDECHKEFELYDVNPELVISFFKERVCVDEHERYRLLQYSHHWASKHDLPSRYVLERKKIVSYVKNSAQDIHELHDPFFTETNVTYKVLLQNLEKVPQSEAILTSDYIEKLNFLLLQSLDNKSFWLALKLEKMFNLRNQNLDVLKLCYELAEGLATPEHLSQDLVDQIDQRKQSLYRSMAEESEKTCLTLIHSMIGKLTHGCDLAYKVFMTYRISVNVDICYEQIVVCSEPLQLLRMVLREGCSSKLEVVHDFMEVFSWSKEEITDFICSEFVLAAIKYAESKIDMFLMWDVKVVDQFHLVLKLIKEECSTLGYKFYNHASVVHQQQESADLDFRISQMSLAVELLIAAHSCFTTDCNMEGISTILRKCRDVIGFLLKVQSWKLIVRLLTGIGRYTELNFVFTLLKDNNQFEYLLGKSSKRDDRLKAACIEYLKKNCPQNKELYKLVAIHFNLHSEVAFVWEREAKGYIKNLLAIALTEMQNSRGYTKSEPIEMLVLTKSHGTKMLLDKAMDLYVQAAEFHTQGDKLSSAMTAARQAELLALQKSLLKVVNQNQTVPCLLHLTNAQISKLMSTELNFHQSHILAQSYNYTPDWAQILHQQVVSNKKMAYLQQFSDTIGLNDELLQKIAEKSLNSQTLTRNDHMLMNYIIQKIESVHLKYRLASQMGFNDLVEEMIDSEEISYLKDTVWKSGYRGRYASRSSDL